MGDRRTSEPNAAILFDYSFVVPSSVTPPKSPSGRYTFPLNPNTGTTSQSYYTDLRDAIKSAKTLTGADLTQWRDAVGDAEKAKEVIVKETKQVLPEDEDEEGDGVEEA